MPVPQDFSSEFSKLGKNTQSSQAQKSLTIRYLPIGDLKPTPGNPRVHSEKQISQLAESIRVFGFNIPVAIDRTLRVIAGHCRVEAAKKLGLRAVPTVYLAHLTSSQVRAFLIADNRLSEVAAWDNQLLAVELKSLLDADLDFDIGVIGFETAEIDLLLECAMPRAKSDVSDDEVPSQSSILVSKIGDVWQLGRHRVLCGDSLDRGSYVALLGDKRASAVFADPPYNVPIEGHVTGLGKIHHREFAMASGELSEAEFIDFLVGAFTNMRAWSVRGSVHFVCIDWRHLYELSVAGRQVFTELKNVCIWKKRNAGLGSLYRSQHELIFVFKNGHEPHRNNIALGKFGRYRTNIWEYPGANSFSRLTEEGDLLALHPTSKPMPLVADALMDVTSRGEIVLDPFLGSGTTVIAAERTGRVGYGLELDPAYVDTAVRRWQRFTGQSATHAVTGRSFEEIEKEVADASR